MLAELGGMNVLSVITDIYPVSLEKVPPVTSAVIGGGLGFGFRLPISTDSAVLGQLMVVIVLLFIHSAVICT